jgi:transglutaminase-like putative cysteine protease
MLDFKVPAIAALIEARGWSRLPQADRIGAIYDFVRNDIPFGYNRADDISASDVLRDGHGQCNTKATLLMALLRGVGCHAGCMGSRYTRRFSAAWCRRRPIRGLRRKYCIPGSRSNWMVIG